MANRGNRGRVALSEDEIGSNCFDTLGEETHGGYVGQFLYRR
jgi:hypothetical protein